MHLVDGVAGTTTANVVDGCGVLAKALLLGKLLVEGEHGSLLLAVDVAGSATARHEVGVGGRRGELDARGRARGVGAVGHVLGVDASDVAGAAATVASIAGGGDGGVRLGDVVGRHCGVVLSRSGGGGGGGDGDGNGGPLWEMRLESVASVCVLDDRKRQRRSGVVCSSGRSKTVD